MVAAVPPPLHPCDAPEMHRHQDGNSQGDSDDVQRIEANQRRPTDPHRLPSQPIVRLRAQQWGVITIFEPTVMAQKPI